MTQTIRGGSVVGCLSAGQQQGQVGFSYSGGRLSRVLKGQDMKEALQAARSLSIRGGLQRKKLQSWAFVSLFMFSSVLLGAHR